jgi:glucosamine kinase
MNLIIDSGATKANWTLADGSRIVMQAHTAGLHPLLMPDETLRALMLEARQRGITLPSHIHYYGTGCRSEQERERIAQLLRELFPTATTIDVQTDLLGAARASCGWTPGIVCILGTGSNACLYDGTQILTNRGGYGFILGDEGSGAAMGRQLLSDFLHDLLPPAIRTAFIERYQLNTDGIIEATYRRAAPSRFLASFAPFLLEYATDAHIRQIIEQQLTLFLQKCVRPYAAAIPVHFIGSIAWHFQAFVQEALQLQQLQLGTISADPMNGLIAFHQLPTAP